MRDVCIRPRRAALRLGVLASVIGLVLVGHAIAQENRETIPRGWNTLTQIAESPGETAFKGLLVKNSPWHVTWETITGRQGTHKLRFGLGKDGGALTGEYFDSSSGTPPGTLDKITVKEKCVKFITGLRRNEYNYCLTDDGILKGTMEGVSSRGNFFSNTAIAKPTKQ